MTEPERLLILDANLAHRMAVDLLKHRRRAALSARQLRLHNQEDPVILRYIHIYWPLAVLVTADDQMPREHAELFDRWKPTVAVIDPLCPVAYRGDDSWHWEIVQRWCHRMQVQAQGTVYRYNGLGGRVWVRPRRIPRLPIHEPPAPVAAEPDFEALLGEGDQGLGADEAGFQLGMFEAK